MSSYDIHQAHILAVHNVNSAKTLLEHQLAESYLRGFRHAMAEADITLDLMACDQHYIDDGVDRPMCCGVWLDWKEADQCQP